MRALFLVHNLPFVGSYFRALQIASRLMRRGHTVDFVHLSDRHMYRARVRQETPGGKGQLRIIETGYRAFLNERQEGWGIFDNAWRVRHAWTGKWDFVYAFSHKPSCVLPLMAARRRGAKTAIDWSDWWGGPEGLFQSAVVPSPEFKSLARPIRAFRRAVFAADSWMEPRACRHADAVTLISGEFTQHPGAPRDLEERSYIMHSGAPLNEIWPRPADECRVAIRLDVPPSAVVLGYVANFHTDEELLLRAFAMLAPKHPNLHLLVVGNDFSAFDPDIQSATAGRIHHVGRKPFAEMEAHLGAADLLLLPLTDRLLNRARYPHKLSDYVAAGRPIIACNVGETGRIFQRFGLGETTPPTPAGFAEGISKMLHRRADWNRIGVQTRLIAEEHFSWEKLCEDLFDFLTVRTGIEF